MTHCEQVQKLQPAFLALELEPAREHEVRGHLASCRECRDAYIAAEPALLLSLVGAPRPVADEDQFVAAVLGGVHQARIARRLGARRVRFYLAAAAAVLLTIAAPLTYRLATAPATVAVAHEADVVPATVATAVEPAFVEVEGQGVRLYQMTAAAGSAHPVQVAFIVDPGLEL